MSKLAENEKQVVDYLLGAMTENARDAFEERLFLDENLSFAVEAAETDLIDEYLRGELEFKEKQRFENNFLITDSRREKLRVAEILNRKLFAEKEIVAATSASFWEKLKNLFSVSNLALAGSAAIILFLLFAGIWFLRRADSQQIADGGNQNGSLENRQIQAPTAPQTTGNQNPINQNGQTDIRQSDSNKNSNSNEKSAPNVNRQKEIKRETLPRPERKNSESSLGSLLAFTLFPATRSGENPELIIAPETETINLRVVHNNEENYVKYRVELRNSDGETVWSREIPAKGKSKSLNFTVNSKLFKSDLYELTLLGVTAAGEYEETNFYNFTVKKK